MSKPKPPCTKECEFRTPYCHNPEVCKDWKIYTEAYEAWRTEVNKARKAYEDYDLSRSPKTRWDSPAVRRKK